LIITVGVLIASACLEQASSINNAVLTFTAAIILFYTKETLLLRKVASKQTEEITRQTDLLTRPILLPYIRTKRGENNNETHFTLRNVGKGPAVDVVIKIVSKGSYVDQEATLIDYKSMQPYTILGPEKDEQSVSMKNDEFNTIIDLERLPGVDVFDWRNVVQFLGEWVKPEWKVTVSYYDATNKKRYVMEARKPKDQQTFVDVRFE
jgi:hypothetical protein